MKPTLRIVLQNTTLQLRYQSIAISWGKYLLCSNRHSDPQTARGTAAGTNSINGRTLPSNPNTVNNQNPWSLHPDYKSHLPAWQGGGGVILERRLRIIVPQADRTWGIWGSYCDIPKAIFYLLKADHRYRSRSLLPQLNRHTCVGSPMQLVAFKEGLPPPCP